jgi:hypothetical protein
MAAVAAVIAAVASVPVIPAIVSAATAIVAAAAARDREWSHQRGDRDRQRSRISHSIMVQRVEARSLPDSMIRLMGDPES